MYANLTVQEFQTAMQQDESNPLVAAFRELTTVNFEESDDSMFERVFGCCGWVATGWT